MVFPLGDPTQNSVLTPNDKKHEAGCLASESHYSLNPFPAAHPDLDAALAAAALRVCVCVCRGRGQGGGAG